MTLNLPSQSIVPMRHHLDLPIVGVDSELTCRLLTYLARRVDTRDVAGWQPLDIEAHYVSADGGAVSTTLGAVDSLRLVHGLPVRDIPQGLK